MGIPINMDTDEFPCAYGGFTWLYMVIRGFMGILGIFEWIVISHQYDSMVIRGYTWFYENT